MPISNKTSSKGSGMILHWAFLILVLFGAYFVWGHWIAKKF